MEFPEILSEIVDSILLSLFSTVKQLGLHSSQLYQGEPLLQLGHQQMVITPLGKST